MTHLQLDEERQLGFAAAEKARLRKAWSLAVLYHQVRRAQLLYESRLLYICG